MILEAKPVGAASFLPVQVVDAAATDPSITVRPTESTVYRWRFVERPLATGSVSKQFRVDVERPKSAPQTVTPKQTQSPAEPEATQPTNEPTSEPTSEPTEEPTEEPTSPATPTETLTPDPTPETTTEPTPTP